MIPFDPENPFPLHAPGSYSYADAKAHAQSVDSWLGFQITSIEEALKKKETLDFEFPQTFWVGLESQAFLTPYLELRTALSLLDPTPQSQVIDLGCGYGRLGHVLGRHYPQVHFTGYEIVSERVTEARRVLEPWNYPFVTIVESDLVRHAPEAGDIYFIYDYGSKPAIQKTLKDLQNIARHRSIAVVARGRASRFFIQEENPWLSQVQDPKHFETFSIYRS